MSSALRPKAPDMMLALIRPPSPSLGQCELTHLPRRPIDLATAARQHTEYGRALERCGVTLCPLEALPEAPDAVFVEDQAVVLDEAALVTRPGALSRRVETAGVERVLGRFRTLHHLAEPATLDGGDVLRVGRTLLVGHSSRTNAAGIEGLRDFAADYGYQVRPIAVRGCLHLKTACTALPDGRLLVNRSAIDGGPLQGFEQIQVPLTEPQGANVLSLGRTVLASAAHPATVEFLEQARFEVITVELSEFEKAEGGVTCLCLMLTTGQTKPSG